MARLLALILTALAVLWVLLIAAAPLALAQGHVVLPALVYELAGLVCHQRPERSFHLAGIQLPVCARCFGLYVSGAAGATAACLASLPVAGLAMPRRAVAILGFAAIPTILTVAGEWVHVVSPAGAWRAAAALPLGAAAGWLFVRALRVEGAAAGGRQMRYHS